MKPSTERERRCNIGLELRQMGENMPGPGMLCGYAARFNTLSDTISTGPRLQRFRERIAPGAFGKGLASADIRALVDHDTALVLGRTTAGTCRVAEDGTGLRVEIDLPDTTAGRDTAVSVSRRDLTGMSFGFYVEDMGEVWDFTEDPPIRTLLDVRIDDVSVVAFPAYPDTSVAMRSLERARTAATTSARSSASVPTPESSVPIPEPIVPTPEPAPVLSLATARARLRLAGTGS